MSDGIVETSPPIAGNASHNGQEKDDGKYRGHFEVPPKARGGRRRQKPISEAQTRALAAGRNKSWTPGCASPNPSGRPRQHRESVDFFRGIMDEIDNSIMETLRKPELTKSDEIRLKGLFAVKEFAFGRNPQSVMVTGLTDAASVDGSGLNALLLRARYEQVKKDRGQARHFYRRRARQHRRSRAPEPVTKYVSQSETNVTPEPEAAAVANPTESVGNPTPAPKAPPLRIVEPDPALAKPKAKKRHLTPPPRNSPASMNF